jgi:GGDEF domain-containing protein
MMGRSCRSSQKLASGLRATFRDTDLLVRWDDHTFAMVGLERSVTNPDVLQARLRERLATHDQGEPLALSCASVRLIPAPGENEHRLIQVLDGALQDGAST